MINAHDGPLAAMAFDMSGAKIATASNKVYPIDDELFAMDDVFSIGNGDSSS